MRKISGHMHAHNHVAWAVRFFDGTSRGRIMRHVDSYVIRVWDGNGCTEYECAADASGYREATAYCNHLINSWVKWYTYGQHDLEARVFARNTRAARKSLSMVALYSYRATCDDYCERDEPRAWVERFNHI